MKVKSNNAGKQKYNRSFKKLEKSISLGTSSDMLAALSVMNGFGNASTEEVGNWRVEAVHTILFQSDEDDRVDKLKLFLDNTSIINDPDEILVLQAVRLRSPGSVKMLLDAGYKPNIGKYDLDDLVRSVCYGFWIHLDRVYPKYFEDHPRCIAFRKELSERMFDPVAYQYEEGLGFLRIEFLDHLLTMKYPQYIASAIYGALSKAHLYPSSSAHNPQDPMPWSKATCPDREGIKAANFTETAQK